MPTPISADRQLYRGRLARTMLLILLCLSLVPLLAMAGTAYWRMRSLLRSQVSTHIATVLDSQARHLTAEVHSGQRFLSHLLEDPSLRASLDTALAARNPGSAAPAQANQAARAEIQAALPAQTHFDALLVVSTDHVIRVGSQPEWEGLAFPAEHLAGIAGEIGASRAIYDLEPFFPDSFVILSAIPYTSQEGKRLGMMIGISGPGKVADLVSEAAFYSTGQYFITAPGEYIEAAATGALVLQNPDVAFRQAITAGLESEARRGVQEIRSIGGKPVVAAYAWLPDIQAGWLVQVEQAQVYGELNSLALLAILLFAATATLVGFVLQQASLRLVRPLRELDQTMQRFAAGQWDQRVSSTPYNEVGLLASSFNSLAEETSRLIHSLESTAAGRTEQARCTAEVAQIASIAASQAELLERLLRLLADRFSCSFAGVYIAETGDGHLVLSATAGPATETAQTPEVDPGSYSLVRWALINRQSRCEMFTPAGPWQDGRTALTGGAGGEAVIPLVVDGQALGVVLLQTHRPEGFTSTEFSDLQMLVDLIAPAVYRFQRFEGPQANLTESQLLFEASHQIAQAESARQILQVAIRALAGTSYTSSILLVTPLGLDLVGTRLPQVGGSSPLHRVDLPSRLPISSAEINRAFPQPVPRVISADESLPDLPLPLANLRAELGCHALALLPVMQGGNVAALLALGTPVGTGSQKSFTRAILQPYISLADLASASLEKVRALEESHRRIAELQTLNMISQATSLETGLEGLYEVIHHQVSSLMGEISFLVALYDSGAQQISIPYLWEDGQLVNVPPFPLGEGLTSILIRTGQPLLLVDDTEAKAHQLGAKMIGRPPKSWLGVPLLVSGKPIGAMIVQDMESEGRFSEQDLHLMTTLAGQIALGIHNARLLESTRRQAEREQVVSRITASTQGSQDLETLLRTAIKEIGGLPQVAEASIHLGPPSRENHNDLSSSGKNASAPGSITLATPGNGRGPDEKHDE